MEAITQQIRLGVQAATGNCIHFRCRPRTSLMISMSNSIRNMSSGWKNLCAQTHLTLTKGRLGARRNCEDVGADGRSHSERRLDCRRRLILLPKGQLGLDLDAEPFENDVSTSLRKVRWRQAMPRFFLITRSPPIAQWCCCLSLLWSLRDFASHIKLLAEFAIPLISRFNSSEIFIWLQRLAWSILDIWRLLCHSFAIVGVEPRSRLYDSRLIDLFVISWWERHRSTNHWSRLRFEKEQLANTYYRSDVAIFLTADVNTRPVCGLPSLS